MKMKRTPYKCGQCGFASLKIVELHEHLLDHSDSVGYYYDIDHKTAYPKWKYDDSLVGLNVYTRYDEGVSIEELHTLDHPEITAVDNRIIKTEMFDVDDDLSNNFEITLQEDITDIGQEFYEGFQDKLPFNDTVESKVEVFNEKYSEPTVESTVEVIDEKCSEPIQDLPSSNINTKQIQRTDIVPQKMQLRGKNGKFVKQSTLNKIKNLKRFQFQPKDANKKKYQLPVAYPTTSDNIDVTDTNKNGNASIDDDLENLRTDTGLFQVEHISKYSEEISLMCEVCGTVVANKQELSKHKKSCFRKRHKCSICDATYKRPWMLQQHQRVHSGECPFVCDQCGKAFRAKPQLFKHQRSVHSDERNFKCDQCGKAFKFKWGLTKHLRIHNDVVLYCCQFCDKKFSTSWNLKAHVRQHTGIKPYSCSKCGQAFAHNVSRKTHEAKCVFIPGGNDTPHQPKIGF